MGLALAVGVRAPLWAAVAFYAGAWLLAQVFGHALYPLLRLTYGDDGGELGRAGAGAAGAVGALFLAAAGTAWATQPPTVHLARGVHAGPLVLDHSQVLIGREGAVVRGGIVIRASDVTVRDVTVIGGENGIDVDDAQRVRLENVHVLNARMDGIHVRRSDVIIRDCTIALGPRPFTQGIDISFSMHRHMSAVEGIVTHSSMVMVKGNRVHGTSLRGITMTEMSMGEVIENQVADGLGVGIFCGDRSECEVHRNVVTGTRVDPAGDLSRVGVGIETDFDSVAELHDNVLVGNAVDRRAFAGARFERP
jgi:nitrous oxidase accessory protein NosD